MTSWCPKLGFPNRMGRRCPHLPTVFARRWQCEYWHTNDGDGLDSPDSKVLALVLRGAVESGRFDKWARKNGEWHEAEGDMPAHYEMGKTLVCRYGYYTNREHVLKFAEFLEHCGGFEMW